MSFQLINPEELGRPSGWTNGMLAPAGGRMLFIAGQTGSDVDPAGDVPVFVSQFERALSKVVAVVREAGGSPEDIGRITVFVKDIDEYKSALKPLGAAYRRVMGKFYPAMALVAVRDLVEPEARLELEATAVLPGETSGRGES